MAARIGALDHATTPLGPFADWPANLKAALDLILPAQAQIVLFWGEDFVALYNDAYAPTIGEKHPRALGRPAREHWAELWDDLEPMLRRVRDAGETVVAKDRPFYIERHGYPEYVYFDISYSPVRSAAGAVDGVLCIVSETTERVVAQRDLADAKERLTQALNASGMVGTFDWRVQTDTFYSDAHFAEMFSVDPDKGKKGAPLGDYLAGIHPDDVARIASAVDEAVATGGKYAQEYRLLQRNGAVRWVEARGQCRRDDRGEPSRFVGVVVDITAQKEAQDRQNLLLLEMDHRIKNLLAVFRGLIGLSARTAKTPDELALSLTGRLDALMRAKALVRPGLSGLEQTHAEQASLDELVRTILQPYDGVPPRASVDGPHAAVGPRAVASLALALHETATNAAKYGALSCPGGTVRVSWRIEQDVLRLTWEEAGGPPVAAAPATRGFGSVVIERSIAGQLGGAISSDWRSSGLTVAIEIPLRRLAE